MCWHQVGAIGPGLQARKQNRLSDTKFCRALGKLAFAMVVVMKRCLPSTHAFVRVDQTRWKRLTHQSDSLSEKLLSKIQDDKGQMEID